MISIRVRVCLEKSKEANIIEQEKNLQKSVCG